MKKERTIDLTLETSRLILLAGDQVLTYKRTIIDEIMKSVDTLSNWIAFFNNEFDSYKLDEFISKTTDLHANERYLRYFIFEKESHRFVGSIVLQDIDTRLPSCEIGYWTVTAAQGNGYMTEAIRFITRYLIEKQNFVRVEAYIDVKNVKSIATIERCDFEREGTLKNADLSPDQSTLINEAIYAITTPVYFK